MRLPTRNSVDAVDARQSGADGDASGLRLDRVVAGYGGGDILRGVTMSVAPGAITCVIGPNGAGKSTMLSVITGGLAPRLGSVMLGNECINGMSPRQLLQRSVAFVPQARSLFPDMTVRENVALGGYALGNKALIRKRAEEIEGTFDFIAKRRHEKAGRLSGGQQRLVEFARCLMLDPDILLLDEPSMGLDPKSLQGVFETILTIHSQGKTVLLVEQNARAALEIADYGIVLENGIVRMSGTGQQVLNHPEIGHLYLGSALTEAPADERSSSPSAMSVEVLSTKHTES